MAEQALVDGKADLGVFDLMAIGLTTKLPGELAHLSDGLGGDGFTETGQTTGSVDRHPAAKSGSAAADE